ncbi:MAG: pyruvate dehydrogenase (acetyl-transferring) E1 component subunit alpha [Myxococcota bacterium]
MAESAANEESNEATDQASADEAEDVQDQGIPSLDEELATTYRDDLGDDRLVEMYETMTLIRRFEEQAGRSYQRGKIKGFCHLYTGQEAVATGAMAAIEDRDYVVAAYREHGHAMARGLDPDAVMAELFGKKTGVSKGKGGSMHLFDVEKNFYGGWGIVAGQIPTATGVAFASKYREEDAVTLCFFGEGSVHQGVFHESLNMASKMDLPVVYIIENNKYAMGTAIERISAVTELDKKALSYDMEGVRIEDGQDIFKVYDGLKKAVDRAREEQRPTLVEVRTYRYKGHSMSDPATYRTKEEVEEAQKRDPIQRFTQWLIDNDISSQEELSEIDERMKSRAKDAVEFADNSDFPDASELTTDIYVDWPAEID